MRNLKKLSVVTAILFVFATLIQTAPLAAWAGALAAKQAVIIAPGHGQAEMTASGDPVLPALNFARAIHSDISAGSTWEVQITKSYGGQNFTVTMPVFPNDSFDGFFRFMMPVFPNDGGVGTERSTVTFYIPGLPGNPQVIIDSVPQQTPAYQGEIVLTVIDESLADIETALANLNALGSSGTVDGAKASLNAHKQMLETMRTQVQETGTFAIENKSGVMGNISSGEMKQVESLLYAYFNSLILEGQTREAYGSGNMAGPAGPYMTTLGLAETVKHWFDVVRDGPATKGIQETVKNYIGPAGTAAGSLVTILGLLSLGPQVAAAGLIIAVFSGAVTLGVEGCSSLWNNVRSSGGSAWQVVKDTAGPAFNHITGVLGGFDWQFTWLFESWDVTKLFTSTLNWAFGGGGGGGGGDCSSCDSPCPIVLGVPTKGETGDEYWDAKYYKFHVTESYGKIAIATTGSGDTKGTLYEYLDWKTSNRCQMMTVDDNSGSGNNFKISGRIDSGYYVIGVARSSSDSGGKGAPYTLYVNWSQN